MGLKTSTLFLATIGVLTLTLLLFWEKPQYYKAIVPKLENPLKKFSSNPDQKYSHIRNITKCSDSEFESNVEGQREDYFVIYNYVKGSRRFKCHESVTFATHGDFSFLDNIPEIVYRWQGPVSVALYTPGNDFLPTVQRIAYLRNCRSPLVKEFVSFHIYFHADHFPKTEYGIRLLEAYSDIYPCHKGEPSSNVTTDDLYRRKNKLFYPINVGRNIAITPSQTHFILSSDIEHYPSKNFIPNFLSMLEATTDLPARRVYVVPVYEVEKGVPVPETKSELRKLVEEKKAVSFHQKLCANCHMIPGSGNWLDASDDPQRFIHATGRRSEKGLKNSEPVFVGTAKEPFYDERLTWEGLSDKLTQAYIMCILDYEYAVLLNEFLVHKPGIAVGMESLNKYASKVVETNKFIVDVVKPQLDAIYGTKEECVMK